MKISVYNRLGWLSEKIPLSFYAGRIAFSYILPFYHSVTDNPKPHVSELNYFRPASLFEEDLDFFTRNYQSVGIDHFDNGERNFHLSFDDGLREMFDVVVPHLLKRGIHATFFITPDFIANRTMFYRHKTSLLLSEIKESNYHLKKVSEFFSVEKFLASDKIKTLHDEVIIEKIAGLIGLNFQDYLHENKPYLSQEQLQEMKKMGFTIANHGKSHINFNTLDFQQQKDEFNFTNRFLSEVLGISNQYFCFPFGDENITNEFFLWMYNEAGIEKSFGVSGLKSDEHKKHYHRILMEHNEYSAEQIIKFEHFYYFLKKFLRKNIIKR